MKRSLEQKHIDTLSKLLDRCNALREAEAIHTEDDAALLSMYYMVPVSIGLTLYHAGMRDRQAIECGLDYYFDKHHVKQGRSETPQAALFKQIAFLSFQKLTPAKQGRGQGGKKGNTRKLIDVLDGYMGDGDEVIYQSTWLSPGSVSVERREGRETEYRFSWVDGAPTQWIGRSSLLQNAASKAMDWLVDTAKEAEDWL
jgi:hypothetical protein